MAEKFPDISKIDVTSGDDVTGFGRLIISLLHENGRIVVNGKPSARQRKLMAITESWLDIVWENVGLLGAEYRAILMDRYDILYRYVYRSIPDMAFIDSQRYSVIESLIKGNKKINIEETLWMIASLERESRRTGDLTKAKKLYDSILKSWVDDFVATGNFLDMPQNEAVGRALAILREDISRFTDTPKTVKKLAADRISLLFNNFKTKDSKTLESMIQYLAFADGLYVDSELARNQIIEILRLLSIMPQVNRFDRQAYANDLKRELATPILHSPY